MALEVQNLLVSGRKKEALQCAQEGQLWGPALVLASQLGDQVRSQIFRLFNTLLIFHAWARECLWGLTVLFSYFLWLG